MWLSPFGGADEQGNLAAAVSGKHWFGNGGWHQPLVVEGCCARSTSNADAAFADVGADRGKGIDSCVRVREPLPDVQGRRERDGDFESGNRPWDYLSRHGVPVWRRRERNARGPGDGVAPERCLAGDEDS